MSRKDLEKKVAEATRMSKPDADNAVVFYDKDGRWIFEVYTANHKVKNNEVD